MALPLLDQVLGLGKNFKTGYQTAERLMTETHDVGHSIFNPKFGQQLSEGAPASKKVTYVQDPVSNKYIPKTTVISAREPITAGDNPAAFLGAYTARLITDAGTDATRRFYWRYNHPLAIADKVLENAMGEKVHQALNPTQRAAVSLATITPVAASLGVYDLANPGELFRPKGYAQQYAAPGSEDRRETAQPAQELFERFFLQRQGQPLKYETAKQDIPTLTPERYGNFMRSYYQDKGLLDLGVIKATPQNLQGVPEARLLGFPVTIPAVTAVAGAAAALHLAGTQPTVRPGRTILAGLAGSVGGAAIGNAVNEIIAMANRPKLPELRNYQENYSSIQIDPMQQDIG